MLPFFADAFPLIDSFLPEFGFGDRNPDDLSFPLLELLVKRIVKIVFCQILVLLTETAATIGNDL